MLTTQQDQSVQLPQTFQAVKLAGPTANKVNFAKYATSSLTCSSPEQKTVPNTGPTASPPSAPQHYKVIPLQYNYGTAEKQMKDDFLLEFPEVKSPWGISAFPKQGGKTGFDFSISVPVDPNTENGKILTRVITDIHGATAFILETYRAQVGLFDFTASAASASGFKCPLKYARDKATGALIEGKNPTISLKLFTRGNADHTYRTLFTTPNGVPIDWDLLKEAEVKLIPLVHIKQIYVGAVKSLQLEMKSAIITDIVARGKESVQTDTMMQLNEANPELSNHVAQQLAKLMNDRIKPTVNLSEKPSTDNKPTFEGIVPTGRPSVPASSNVPNVPAVPTMPDFTSQAPQRPAFGMGVPVQIN